MTQMIIFKSLKSPLIQLRPLALIFVNYEKAFDTIDPFYMLKSLSDGRIDYRYTQIIKYIYENATASVKTQKSTNTFKIDKGVRQGDTISKKMFASLLEYRFKSVDFDGIGININGENLTHLRFADDIVLITHRINHARTMLQQLNAASQNIGLRINLSKTQLMTNLVLSDGVQVEETTVYNELQRRIGLTCRNNNPNKKGDLEAQSDSMERSMLGLTLREHITNTELRKRTGLVDAEERSQL
ncbi:hypothetical protein HUJ04_010951 [Dendroctonus ponderosae]|nr:hypothetical protein HUJ04_010951 [Dendroctonus ponderosae]